MAQTVGAFLASQELSEYEAAFEDEGWDSLSALLKICDEDFATLRSSLLMSR